MNCMYPTSVFLYTKKDLQKWMVYKGVSICGHLSASMLVFGEVYYQDPQHKKIKNLPTWVFPKIGVPPKWMGENNGKP